jgi:hypothetical protein
MSDREAVGVVFNKSYIDYAHGRVINQPCRKYGLAISFDSLPAGTPDAQSPVG